MRRHPSKTPASLMQRALRWRATSFAIALATSLLGLPVHAAVDLPNTPLQSGTVTPANIMFILDDSGSMTSNTMPDGYPATTTTNIAAQAYTRNTLYYNPTITYRGWKQANGTRMAEPGPAAAWSDVNYASNATNLTSSTQRFYVPISTTSNQSDGTAYYRYELTSATTARRCIWRPVQADWNNCTAVSSFDWNFLVPVTVPPAPALPVRTLAEEWQNYANWYSFSRTRIKAAKAGASEAFSGLGSNIRVGFDTLWDRSAYDIPVTRNNGLFEDVAGAPNRSDWFAQLFAAYGNSNTPLQQALNRTGQYFSGSASTGPYGPESGADQITCRQNFAILTTDGYWNGGTLGGDQDNTAGSVITSPTGATYQYTPAPPYAAAAAGTLADVAMRYWKNDLRTDMANNVPTNTGDPGFWQHMVTFGISIGLRGSLDPDSDLVRPGPSNDLSDGGLSWPDPVTPNVESLRRIDDLWHAAVNGRGTFVAAGNPTEFADALKNALASIIERTGSSSNVSVNGAKVGSNTQLFQASFVSGLWTGEVKAYPVTASGVGATPTWLASEHIPSSATRKVFTKTTGGTATSFTWAGLDATQQGLLGDADVVDYLRGNQTKEISNGGTFRNRSSVLGDIDHSSPAYVDIDIDGDPATNDPGSSKTVYVGSNDGMLHAIDAATGNELFAYVPPGIDLSKLKTLSDKDYAHHYFADGEIAVSTRQQTPGKNILVGLLGRGGKTIYALDVSDPANFDTSKVLWSYTDPGLGNALGEPLITKLNNGQTGVIIGNGYNSNTEQSSLYILNIETGALIKKLATGAGSAATPNGMATPRGWDSNRDGSFDALYAGDLLGNVWKFDISASNPATWGIPAALGTNPLTVATNAAGTMRQPITGPVAIALNPITYKRWIYFGTGRYLTAGDPANRDPQAWYGVIDEGTGAVARTDLKQRSVSAATNQAGNQVRVFDVAVAGDMAGKKGWVVNLEVPVAAGEGSERIITRSLFQGGVLISASIIPSDSSCSTGGRGYINAIDPFTGGALTTPFWDVNNDGVVDATDVNSSGTAIGSLGVGGGMPTLPAVIQNGSNGQVLVLYGDSSGGRGGRTGSLPGSWGRISWREIVRD